VELEVAPGAAKKSNGRLELSLALPCSTASTCTQPDGWPVRLLEPVHAIGLRTEKSRYRPASVGTSLPIRTWFLLEKNCLDSM